MTASYANVREHVETASMRATWWDGRATNADLARARQAGSDAVTAIDATLRALYQLRKQLVGELVRADRALLDQCDAFDTYRDNTKAGSCDRDPSGPAEQVALISGHLLDKS